MWKRAAALVISIAVSAVFLWWALRDIPLAEVTANIRQARPGWLLIGLAAGLTGIYTRGIRWRGLVNFQIDRRRAFYIVGIMMMLNLLFRLGEVARTVLARRERVPVVTAATSIVVERLLDTVLVLLVLAITFSQVTNMPPEVALRIQQIAPLFVVASVVGFAVLVALARFPTIARNLLHWFTARLPFLERLPLDDLLEHLLLGLRPLTNPVQLAHAIGWTLISWTFSYIMFLTTFYAFGMTDLPAVLLESGLAMSLASLSVAPPSVGAIGVFEAAVILAGQAFGTPRADALAVGFTVHTVTIVVYIITGLIGFAAMGVALTEVVDADDPAAEEIEVTPAAGAGS